MADVNGGPSKPDKHLWPDYTKQDLWDYLGLVGDRMLEHMVGRPLTLLRYPDGVGGNGWFQKDIPKWAPKDLERFDDDSESAGKTISYAVARTVGDLQWMGNMGCLEWHHWTSTVDRPDRPDRCVFDLDLGTNETDAAWAAQALRRTLDTLGLPSVVKSSGKRGLHVLVPVERRYDSSELRGFALAVGKATAAMHPDRLTVHMRKADRKGRLLIDWSRNGSSQTVVAAWSPRAVPEATVSVPLDWDEVGDDWDPAQHTIATAPDRPATWEWPAPVRIEAAREALAESGFESIDQSPRARTK